MYVKNWRNCVVIQCSYINKTELWLQVNWWNNLLLHYSLKMKKRCVKNRYKQNTDWTLKQKKKNIIIIYVIINQLFLEFRHSLVTPSLNTLETLLRNVCEAFLENNKNWLFKYNTNLFCIHGLFENIFNISVIVYNKYIMYFYNQYGSYYYI